jgi:serine/threonine-protein kinase
VNTQYSDRNLLFGILALQRDFIGREALVSAMHAWLLAKDRPLGDLLVEQGALAPARRASLDKLVEEHLCQHCGDAARSLTALTSAELADSLRQLEDPDLNANLACLTTPPTVSGGVTQPPRLGDRAEPGVRFRVLRPHARGGLGEVFGAYDRELHLEVALKEMLDKFASDAASRVRFLLEAEITGGLEHPGIVPVYGLGQYADGRPYYAMRFIQGDSMEEAINRFHDANRSGRDPGERSLELRRLLMRFVAVCETVAYAHSRGVLHRDLKPANTILGVYGETLLVDWGLAKSLASSAPSAGEVSFPDHSTSNGAERGETPLRPQSSMDGG